MSEPHAPQAGPALAARMEEVRQLQGAFLDPYVVVDLHRRICAFNRAFYALFPRRVARTLEGRPLHEVLSFRVRGDLFDLTRECLERAAPVRYDQIEGHGAEGATWTMIAAAAPLKEDASCVGALLVLRDVTDEVKIQAKYRSVVGEEEGVREGLEEVLARRSRELVEANEALNRLQQRLSRYERGLELPVAMVPERG